MSDVRECLNCGEPFLVSAGRNKCCGSVCLTAYAKGVTRQKYHNFFNSLSYYEQLLLDEILEEEWEKQQQN